MIQELANAREIIEIHLWRHSPALDDSKCDCQYKSWCIKLPHQNSNFLKSAVSLCPSRKTWIVQEHQKRYCFEKILTLSQDDKDFACKISLTSDVPKYFSLMKIFIAWFCAFWSFNFANIFLPYYGWLLECFISVWHLPSSKMLLRGEARALVMKWSIAKEIAKSDANVPSWAAVSSWAV